VSGSPRSETSSCVVEQRDRATILRLTSTDGINRLTLAVVRQMRDRVEQLAAATPVLPLIITGNTGNDRFFSTGADLTEIAAVNGAEAFEFPKIGQRLTQLVDDFPALTIAAISGYCMGGSLDLALACDMRIAAPNAIFGHRGAALGIVTGWGGTQRLPRLIGKARALQMFCAAERCDAPQALAIGLVNALADDPVKAALEQAAASQAAALFP
jgi:enoyl-CoA hydratase